MIDRLYFSTDEICCLSGGLQQIFLVQIWYKFLVHIKCFMLKSGETSLRNRYVNIYADNITPCFYVIEEVWGFEKK